MILLLFWPACDGCSHSELQPSLRLACHMNSLRLGCCLKLRASFSRGIFFAIWIAVLGYFQNTWPYKQSCSFCIVANNMAQPCETRRGLLKQRSRNDPLILVLLPPTLLAGSCFIRVSVACGILIATPVARVGVCWPSTRSSTCDHSNIAQR